MAFLAELTAQTEELVTAVAGTSPKHEPQTFSALREATLRTLRQQQHSHGRTNQFDVEGRLDGLAERFAVVGRDEMADELQRRRARLAEMYSTTKWMPDLLKFLLELSDQPADLASLDALHALCASRVVHEPPPLRWEDIAREDGWGRELAPSWRSDGGDTTADEGTSDDDEDDDDDDDDYDDDPENNGSDEDTTLSSIGTQEQQQQQQNRLLRDFAAEERSAETQAALLQAIRASQSWRLPAPELSTSNPGDGAIAISELQLLRETLFMLQGLDTTVFGVDYTPARAYRLSGVTLEAHSELVASVAASGRKVGLLRRRVGGIGGVGGVGSSGGARAATPNHNTSNVPLLQVFQEAIGRRLQTFDREVAAVQARFVAIQHDTLVSLVAVLDELQPSLACLAALSAVVERLEVERRHAHAFRYLELLFDAAAMAQLEGDARLYEFLGTVFFDCFQVYLRPIRLWMEEGQLMEGDKVFFVAGAAAQMPLNQIWQHQYKLLRTSSGVLHAPKFLQPAALKIFTTGKSIVVLRQLGRSAGEGSGSSVAVRDGPARTRSAVSSKSVPSRAAEPTLDFATVCPPEAAMAPLAQLFSDAFARWIQSKHHAASATLKATLFDACGLWASLEALHGVYLMADGAAVDAFVSRVFQGLDTGSPRWHDRYTLTEQAREAFSERLDAARLSVSVVDEVAAGRGHEPDAHSGHSNDPAAARRSVRGGVARIRVHYRLAWPVQMIIPADCITGGYQALFTLLLQVRRANSVLSRHRLLLDASSGLPDVDTTASVSGQESAVAAGDRALYFALRAKLVWFCNTLQSYLVTLVIAPRLAALQTDLQRRAVDVDAMIAVHAACLRGLVDEACLGVRLQPIHDALVDVLDLALRLEDARRANAAREASALQETWRLSVLSSPFQPASASKRRTNATTPRSQNRKSQVDSPAGGSAVRRRLFSAAKTPPRQKQSSAIDDVFGMGADHEVQNGDSDNDSDSNAGRNGGQQANYDDEDEDENGGDPVMEVSQERYGDVLRSISSAFTGHLRFITSGLRSVARASSDATAAAKWDMLAETMSDGSHGGW